MEQEIKSRNLFFFFFLITESLVFFICTQIPEIKKHVSKRETDRENERGRDRDRERERTRRVRGRERERAIDMVDKQVR
jgi:hypothetical protein